MQIYKQALTEHAPEMDAEHMLSLAYAIGSTLNGMDDKFFREVALLARRMGPERLAEVHAGQIV